MSLTDRVLKVPPPPPERFFDAERLREKTGGAPTPWWWSREDAVADSTAERPGRGSRPPSAAHSEFAAAALGADTESHRDAYVHWLYAQSLGYQGFSVPLQEPWGQLAMTTPMPLKERHSKIIRACAVEIAAAQQLFSDL